jgi:hypothetical protein
MTNRRPTPGTAMSLMGRGTEISAGQPAWTIALARPGSSMASRVVPQRAYEPATNAAWESAAIFPHRSSARPGRFRKVKPSDNDQAWARKSRSRLFPSGWCPAQDTSLRTQPGHTADERPLARSI